MKKENNLNDIMFDMSSFDVSKRESRRENFMWLLLELLVSIGIFFLAFAFFDNNCPAILAGALLGIYMWTICYSLDGSERLGQALLTFSIILIALLSVNESITTPLKVLTSIVLGLSAIVPVRAFRKYIFSSKGKANRYDGPWELVTPWKDDAAKTLVFLKDGEIKTDTGKVSSYTIANGILHVVKGNAIPLGEYRMKKEYPKLVLTSEKVDSKESEQRKADG